MINKSGSANMTHRDLEFMKMLQTTSLYYIKEPDTNQSIRKDGLVNIVDKQYLQSYAQEQLIDLIEREELNQFKGLVPSNFHRSVRADAIDRLFHGAC